jgi:hypothetical protein
MSCFILSTGPARRRSAAMAGRFGGRSRRRRLPVDASRAPPRSPIRPGRHRYPGRGRRDFFLGAPHKKSHWPHLLSRLPRFFRGTPRGKPGAKDNSRGARDFYPRDLPPLSRTN